MYRKSSRGDRSTGLDLDSLMDILSCLVGVMLFLVIYTVLELGSAAYQAEVIVSPEARPSSRRVLVLCYDDHVRVLDAMPPSRELLNGFEIVRTVAEAQLFIQANQRPWVDPYFAYSLRYAPRSTTDLLARVDLVVQEREDVPGETIDELDERSLFVETLDDLDPYDVWLSFVVDQESVDLFRRAREVAIARGFAARFDLLTVDFPLTVPLSQDGLGDVLSPVTMASKPLE